MSGLAHAVLVEVILLPQLEGADNRARWLVWNIPAATTSVAEGVRPVARLPDGSKQMVVQGRNGGPPVGFRDPCSLPGQPHHYSFEVFALDSKLDSVPVGSTRGDVMSAMDGHILGHAVLMTKFNRE